MELSTPLPSSPTSRRNRSRLRCLLFTTKSWTRSVPTRLQQCMRGQGRREKRIHIKSGSLGHLQKETMLGRTVVETKKRTMVERQKRRKEKNPRKKSNSRTAFAQPVFAQPAGPPQPIWTHQPCPVHGQHFLPVEAWGASPVHLGCPVQYHPVGVIPAPWRQSPNPGTTSKAAAVARERVVLRAKPKPSSISSSEEEKKKKKGCGTRKLKKHLPHQTQALRMQQKIHMGGDLQKNCEKHWEQKLWKRGHSQNLLPAANHLPRRKQSH